MSDASYRDEPGAKVAGFETSGFAGRRSPRGRLAHTTGCRGKRKRVEDRVILACPQNGKMVPVFQTGSPDSASSPRPRFGLHAIVRQGRRRRALSRESDSSRLALVVCQPRAGAELIGRESHRHAEVRPPTKLRRRVAQLPLARGENVSRHHVRLSDERARLRAPQGHARVPRLRRGRGAQSG
jgi:hypothetical protein